MKKLILLFTILTAVNTAQARAAQFKETICPQPQAIAKAFLELQLCHHPESFPFLLDRPYPQAADNESGPAAAVETTEANPGYVIDKIMPKDSDFEVRFHYLIEKSGVQKSVADSIAFSVYTGNAKAFAGCASQTTYPKRKVVRASCTH